MKLTCLTTVLATCGFAFGLTLGLGACTSIPSSYVREDQTAPRYWQRVTASTSLYLYGPKAQQMLEKDYSACEDELLELGRLGGIQYFDGDNAAPTVRPPVKAYHGKRMYHAGSEEEYNEAEVLRHDRIRADYLPYHDMTGCMASKGWEPAKNVEPSREEKNIKENRLW